MKLTFSDFRYFSLFRPVKPDFNKICSDPKTFFILNKTGLKFAYFTKIYKIRLIPERVVNLYNCFLSILNYIKWMI